MILMILMDSIHLKNNLILNHFENNDSDFNFESILKARFWFWLEIIFQIILPNAARLALQITTRGLDSKSTHPVGDWRLLLGAYECPKWNPVSSKGFMSTFIRK